MGLALVPALLILGASRIVANVVGDPEDIEVDWHTFVPATSETPSSWSPGGTWQALEAGEDVVLVGPQSVRLEEVDEVAWLTDDRLVAFGRSGPMDMGFDGLAVVDLDDEDVDQVDLGFDPDAPFAPTRLRPDGRLGVCTLVYDQTASAPTCAERYVLDPDEARLVRA